MRNSTSGLKHSHHKNSQHPSCENDNRKTLHRAVVTDAHNLKIIWFLNNKSETGTKSAAGVAEVVFRFVDSDKEKSNEKQDTVWCGVDTPGERQQQEAL